MRPFLSLCLSALILTSAAAASAQESSPIPVPPGAAEVSDPAAATRAWLATVPADKRAKSDAYFEGKYWLILWNFLLAAGISIFLLESRISARLRDFAERRTHFKALQVVIYGIGYLALASVLAFPLVLYERFFREHKYGLATQSFAPWFGEQMKALLVEMVALSVLLIALYAVFRRAPRTWWLWGTAVVGVFFTFGVLIAPLYIEP